jgi:nucleoside-diphosphate-sugar epimerase
VRTIFLTGASGVVGDAVLRRTRGRPVCALVHRAPVDGIESVTGNLTAPRLGLSPSAYERLADCTGAVGHAGAIADFTRSDEEIHATNVEGTKRVLELAYVADAPVVYISTAYAALEAHPDLPARTELREAEITLDAYLASKRGAEELVRSSGLPATIVRLPVVGGETGSGYIAHFQALYIFARYLMTGTLPFLPIDERARLDIVPADIVADAILAAADGEATEPLYWLTAGDDALPVTDFVELCAELAETMLGARPPAPRFVDPAIVDRLLRPVLLPRVPPRARVRLEGFFQFLRVLDQREPFPSDLARLGAGERVDVADTVRNSLSYWFETCGAELMKPASDDLAALAG